MGNHVEEPLASLGSTDAEFHRIEAGAPIGLGTRGLNGSGVNADSLVNQSERVFMLVSVQLNMRIRLEGILDVFKVSQPIRRMVTQHKVNAIRALLVLQLDVSENELGSFVVIVIVGN
jgi:hypothetical protein